MLEAAESGSTIMKDYMNYNELSQQYEDAPVDHTHWACAHGSAHSHALNNDLFAHRGLPPELEANAIQYEQIVKAVLDKLIDQEIVDIGPCEAMHVYYQEEPEKPETRIRQFPQNHRYDHLVAMRRLYDEFD
jgi:hypothetical protein